MTGKGDEAAMLIAQLSDTHITQAGGKACRVADANAAVARCVARINALTPRPDLALITGDITNDGDAEQSSEAARILSGLEMPFHVIPGNHDRREALSAAFGARRCGGMEEGYMQYSFDHAGVRFIAVDSTAPDTAGGVFCETRARWLRRELERAGDMPVIIFMHHPPLKFGVLETDADGFEGAELLAGALARHERIERILCGHIHLNAHAMWRGIAVSAAPAASGMRLALDLTMREDPAFIIDEGSFLLHQRTADGELVSHCLNARMDEPRHLFHPE